MSRVAVLSNHSFSQTYNRSAPFVPYPHVCRTREELEAALQIHVFEALILGVFDNTQRSTLDLIVRIRRSYPLMHIVVWTDVTQDPARASKLFFDAAQAGAHECVLTLIDAYTAVKQKVERGTYESIVLNTVMPTIESFVPPLIQDFISAAIRRGRQAPTVDAIANTLGHRRQIIARVCNAAHLPSPLELVSWGRLLVASAILDQPGITVDQVGLRLFGSPAAFRNMIRRKIGLTPKALRSQGPFRSVVAEFTQRLQESVKQKVNN